MNVTSTSCRSACLIASMVLALTGVNSRGAEKTAQTDAFPRFESYVKVTGQAASVSGNDSSFARRFQMPQNGSYGIEGLHLVKELSKDSTMEIDGRALTGAEDYLGKLLLTKNEVGSVEVGYKRFRTFYDGIGGFFPLNNKWNVLKDEELHTDRARFWAKAKIERPNQPTFELSYVNELRNGQKDTTIWGDSDFTGIPVYYGTGSSNPVSSNRKIIPSYIDLGERQETLMGVMKHKAGNTEFEVEVINNRTNSLDTRWVNRYPGELKPYPALTATSPTLLADNALANNPIFGFDTQGSKANVFQSSVMSINVFD